MASHEPRVDRGLLLVGCLAGAALSFTLAGCSSTTYGTGTSPGLQTVKDIAGIALISGPKPPPIDYSARPKVVAPPDASAPALPPPEPDAAATSADATSADAPLAAPPNWPKDPDVAAAKFRADIAAREARGEAAPALKLPAEALPHTEPQQMTWGDYHAVPRSPQLTADQQTAMRKAFADAKGLLAVDANGKPIRKYLTEPPTEYREPDPTQPVVFTQKAKKFHWWWQKQDNTDTLTPDTTATTEAAPASSN